MFDNARRRYARIRYILNAPITELVFGGTLKGGKAFYQELKNIGGQRRKDAQTYLDVAKAVHDFAKMAEKSATVRAQGLEKKVKGVNVIYEESEEIIWVEPPKPKLEAVQDALRLYCINYRFYNHDRKPMLRVKPKDALKADIRQF